MIRWLAWFKNPTSRGGAPADSSSGEGARTGRGRGSSDKLSARADGGSGGGDGLVCSIGSDARARARERVAPGSDGLRRAGGFSYDILDGCALAAVWYNNKWISKLMLKIEVLEHMLLNPSAEPVYLPLSLLEDITIGFAVDLEIGSGGFAVVYKGILKNGMVAVKKLSKTYDIHEKQFIKEISCLMKAKHKNVVRFLGYCSDAQGVIVEHEGGSVMADVRQMLLCFEYLPGGSLDKYITGVSCVLEWTERYRIIKEICEGLHYLHVERRIVHLDLKPTNILFDNNMAPKIADFGLSRRFIEKQRQIFTAEVMGTLGYMAPEFLTKGQITLKSDIHSLGVIITEILTGQKGYCDVEHNSQRDIHMEQVRVCTEIGIECTEKNPAKRPFIQHIISRLDESKSDSSDLYKYTNKEPGETSSDVLYISWNRLEKSHEDTHMEQVRGEIGTECTENSPPRRSVTRHTTELDEIESAEWSTETSGSSSPVHQADKDSSELHPWTSGDISNEGGHRGTILMYRYEIGRRLGHGNFTRAYFARNLETAQAVAIKIIDKDKVQLVQIEREVSVMRKIRHPNIVEIFEVMAAKSKIYFVLEFARGGELFKRMSKGKFSENVARRYFHQLISAVNCCHKQGVYHGDLKPENLLLDQDENLKVLGFGSSFTSEPKRRDGLLHTTNGTPAYVAPEVLNSTGSDGFKADIWSCGVILFVLVAGYLPFHDTDLAEMCRLICKADYRCPPSFSDELKDLLYKVLDPDVSTRISISKIKMSAWYRKPIAASPHERRNKIYNAEPAAFDSPEYSNSERGQVLPYHESLNAFHIISISAGFDISSLFVERYDRMKESFTTREPAQTILAKLNELAKCLKLKFYGLNRERGYLRLAPPEPGLDGFVQVRIQISEFGPSILLVELSRYRGDHVEYKQLMKDEIRPAFKDIAWAWFPPTV